MAREVTVQSGAAREVAISRFGDRTVTAVRRYRFGEFLLASVDGDAIPAGELHRKRTLLSAAWCYATVTGALLLIRLQGLLGAARAQAAVEAGIGGYRPVYGGANPRAYLNPPISAIRHLYPSVAGTSIFTCSAWGGLRGLSDMVAAAASCLPVIGGLRGLSQQIVGQAAPNPDLRNLGYLVDSSGVRITDSSGADITIYA